jgi:hypothetical protein
MADSHGRESERTLRVWNTLRGDVDSVEPFQMSWDGFGGEVKL